MKKYVLQWRDPDGFLHFVPSSLYDMDNMSVFDTWDQAYETCSYTKENIAEFLKGKQIIVKRRLFGPPTVRIEKPNKVESDLHKRILSTIHIAEINIVPKQMR